MKKFNYAKIVLAVCISYSFSTNAADFTNGGFESGDLSGWTQGSGTWIRGAYNPSALPPIYIDPATLTGPGISAVVSTGFDPVVTTLPMVYAGSNAVRVNFAGVGPSGGQDASWVSQTVSNYGSNSINFAWSAVLQNGGHPADEQAHFYIQVIDVTASNSVLLTRSYNASSPNIFTISNGALYSGWQSETISVTQGNTYKITLLAADCSAGGHYGYVYLDGFGLVAVSNLLGPSLEDTTASLQASASQLRSAFNMQSVAASFALNYDCNVFDVRGMCISAGGRYTTIDNPSINNSAAVVTLGYKVNPSIRIGGYLDQNINISNPTGINISNNTPLMGLYAVWNKEQSGLGYQVRLANTYQDKDVTQTRSIFGTSEAGMGRSSLKSQSYLAELSYAFQYQDRTLVRPYAGLRYTHLKQDGYTEATTDAVTDPLTVAAIRDKGTTALLGVKVNRSLTDKATLTAQLGLEQDVHHKVGDYSATNSDIGDLSSIAFNSNIKRTRPVASIGAFYDVTKTQRASASINYLQTAFQSTGSTTAFFNYMIGF